MGEIAVHPTLNVHDKYIQVNIINPYRFGIVDPLNNTFNPSGNQLWSNPANWSSGHVPLATETATIDGGTIILDITTTVNKLVITASGSLTSLNAGARVLTVNTSVNSLGVINLSAGADTLELKGTVNAINKAGFTPGTLSSVHYSALGAQTVLDLNYGGLKIGGTGFKTLSAHTTVAGNLSILGSLDSAKETGLQLSTFNFSVSGTTNVGRPGILAKNSNVGSTLFVGLVDSGEGDYKRFDFSGNPNIEFRGGLTTSQHTGNIFGTGTFSFSTNNQSLTPRSSNNMTANILIVGNITLTLAGSYFFFGTINGTAAGSTFNNNGGVLLRTLTTPMLTGVFNYRNAAGSAMGYLFNGDFTLPYTLYNNLYVDGTGVKKLSGATVLNGLLGVSQQLGSVAILDLEGNSLTVTGVTNIFQPCKLRKWNTAGTTIFIGKVNCSGGDASRFDFVGAINVEFRGGLHLAHITQNAGSGVFRFTTNAQSITADFTAPGLTADIRAENITLTNSVAGNGIILTGKMSTTGTGKIDNRGVIKYRNAEAPMASGGGTLELNAAANTFIYDGNLNQDVKGGTYRSLTLANTPGIGAVVKKLAGNVSVINTYTLTSPATLDLNGFTLANP